MLCRSQSTAGGQFDRAFFARLLLVVCAPLCLLILQACRASRFAGGASESGSPEIVSATPPYTTREPERYQAIRIITIFEPKSATPNSSATDRTTKVLISRDGAKRREEYLSPANGPIIYLEIPAGRFVLLPASKLYADLDVAESETGPIDPMDESSVMSAAQLLSEAHAAAKYEILGTEVVGGRITTKYLVTTTKPTNENKARGESLIWFDEALGMPIKSEATYGVEAYSKLTMELKDVTLEVDQRLFELPPNYKKVAARLIHDQIRKTVPPASGERR